MNIHSNAIKVGMKRDFSRGFALIVTLTLMMMLAVIIVGMLSLATVSVRTGNENSALQEASANARMALIVAIGELQVSMGPDQRISAPGSQLLDATDDSGRKNWTGVYDSWPASSENRPEPTFRRWLISGDDMATSNSATVAGGELADQVITLVGEIEAGTSEGLISSASEAVEAGLVSVENGGIAWWIGDNHTKAKLGNLAVEASDEEESLAQWQSAPQALAAPFIGDGTERNDPQMGRVFTLASLDFLPAAPQSLFHDATTLADGLVTNVRDGGFRKDLSFFLQKPFSEVDKDPLYSAGSTPGINFRELWADYNIWGEVQTSGLPSHADGSNFPSGTPYLASPATLASAHQDPFRNHRQPTRIRHVLAYSMISRLKAGSTDEYDLFLVVDPLTTLWNPFNVAYYLPTGAFNSFQNWAVPYRLSLVIQRANGTASNWSANVAQISGTGFNQTKISKGENLVMRPGEVQILSQSYRDQINNGGSIDAKLGWNFGSGFAYSLTVPKKDDAGNVIENNSLHLPVIKGDDRLTFFLEPTTNGQSHGLGLTLSRQYIGDEGPYPNGNFSIDWTTIPDGNRDGNLASKDRPIVFRKIDRDPSYSKIVADMNAPEGTNGALQKWPLFEFTMDVRTEVDAYAGEISTLPPSTLPPRFTSRSLLAMNPKIFAYDLGDLSSDYSRETPIQIGLRKLTSLDGLVDTAGSGFGYFGASHKADGTSNVVTHAIPQAPIFSLGALQHSIANGLLSDQEIAAKGSNLSRVWYLRPAISHAISNSFAPSIMPKNATAISRGQGKYRRDLADHSFLVNRALWDDYFFSSISPKTTTAHKNPTTAYSEQKQRLTTFLESGGNSPEPLPNPRMKPWSHSTQATVDEIFNGNTPTPDAAERIAAHLIVDGTFNVNSTSVAAWRSLLGALKGNSVPVRTPTSGAEATLTEVEGTPIANLLPPAGEEISKSSLSNYSSLDQWLGFRALSDEEIDELAIAIVKQVRLRGPFTSLADFINRRPGNDTDTALSGALQSALDDEDVSINEDYRDGSRALSVADASSQGFNFPEAAAGAKSAGAPGYVKQADLLTPLAPLITVRGDTFTIRTYGEARDKNDEIIAKAYCEAVVRRVPDYVDPSDDASDPHPSSLVNQKFGRKLEIVSFRFLNDEEI